MENDSDQDREDLQNIYPYKFNCRSRKFYNGQETVPSQRQWETGTSRIAATSGYFSSSSEQNGRGYRSRGQRNRVYRSRGQRNMFNKSMSNRHVPKYNKKQTCSNENKCKNELEMIFDSDYLQNINFNLPSESSNLCNNYNKQRMNEKKDCNFEFLPNSVNVNKLQSNEHMKKNENSDTEVENNVDESSVSVLGQFRKTQEALIKIKKSIQPSEIIMCVRKDIEFLCNECTSIHLQKIDTISSQMLKNKTYELIYKPHYHNLQLQQSVFDASVTNIKHNLNFIPHSTIEAIINVADNAKLQIENECRLLQRAFPAYAYKRDILDALSDNQVVFISGDCSYHFNIVIPVIVHSELPNYSIISCESNDMVSKYVKDKFENIVKKREENTSNINFLTEERMLTFFTNGTKTEHFITIVNLPVKRSISIDLLLAFLQSFLLKQKDSKLILLLSIFDDVAKYQNYFASMKLFILEVPKLLLPVKTMWKKEASKTYKEDVVCTALSIHILNESGNILAFLPNIAEAKLALSMFIKKMHELNYDNIECVLLDETISVPNSFYSSTQGKRTIYFTSDCSESIPIPSVRYVIDSGLKRDYIFDKPKNLDILTTVFNSRAKARVRKSLVGVYVAGICYRLYNKENFCYSMISFERPNLLTLNPFNVLMKIFQYFPENALSIKFVEPLNDAVKYNNIKLLKKFNAIKNGKLTELGKKMVKLPIPARYSKMIFQAIGWGYAYEAVILAAYFSVDLFLFKHITDDDEQQKLDATKLDLIENESDALSFLSLYKTWIENRCGTSWCDKFYINCNTLEEIKRKSLEICHYVYEFANEDILQEFNETEELSSDILKILLHSFSDHFCVFSGHYRSGYKILSSSQTAFIHPSSMICNRESLPQFIIFNKMICSTRNFLIGITAIPSDLVENALKDGYDKILDYDYSDVFERCLVKKTIEPVGERIIKQVLLGKKGGRLYKIENFIKEELKTEFIIIEPLVERGCVHVYALESFSDSATKMVDEFLKNNIDDVLNAEQVHTLELKKGEIIVPLEVTCVIGAKITSVKIKDSLNTAMLERKDLNMKPTSLIKKCNSIQYSLNLTWIRRPCNGICYLNFTESDFKDARRLATKSFLVMGSEVDVSMSRKEDNQLVCFDVPPEARVIDIEKALKILPYVKVKNIELIFTPSFETTAQDLSNIKIDIQEICEKYTKLSEFEIIVPKPKNSATIMKVYVNVFCTTDLTETATILSNVSINKHRIDAKPVYRSIINTTCKIFKALEMRLKEELTSLKMELTKIFPNKDLFCFEAVNVSQDLVLLKLLTNDIKIMKELQSTVHKLLEGEVFNKSTVKGISKLFCHGGHMWLRTLEKSKKVIILEEYNSKVIRVYGSQENCFKVKNCILSFLEDTENEAVETIILNDNKNNRILLKSIIRQFGVNLETFVEMCGLLTAVLDIKFNRLLIHGNREGIDKAKEVLNELSNSLDSTQDCSLLSGEELCPVCVTPAFNLTFRLQHCGHLYCSECILNLVLQAKFPIQCCAEDCSDEIVLDDIIQILDENEEKIAKFLYASLENYLDQISPEVVYCPAPDCSMFFFKKDVSERCKCPLCQNEICINCHVVFHHGYTCDMFQGSRRDPDYSFKEWRKIAVDCKECPNCKTPIQKNAGCDHMTCILCQAHFCWVCLREFSNEMEVYNHIPFCDKYPKW